MISINLTSLGEFKVSKVLKQKAQLSCLIKEKIHSIPHLISHCTVVSKVIK